MRGMMKSRTFLCYFCCGALSFMWQTSNTLAASNHPVFGFDGNPTRAIIIFALHYLLGGLGMIAFGLLCDKLVRSNLKRRRLAAVLAASAGLLTFLRIILSSAGTYYAAYLLATVLGFGANAIILGGIFSKVSYATKPLVYGFAFATAVLLRLPIDLYNQNAGAMTHTAYVLFGCAALLLLAAALLSKPVKLVFEREEAAQEQTGNPRLLTIAIACSLAVYVLFGIFDELVSGTPVTDDYIMYVRLIQIVVPILTGAVCYRWGHYAAVLSSVTFLGIGTLAYFFSYGGLGGLLCAIATVVGHNLFTGPARSLFADLGRRGKYPYTVAALGFAAYFLFQILGIPVANLIALLGKDGGLVLYLSLFMLSVPLIMFFFHMLKTSHAGAALPQTEQASSTPRQDSIQSYGLTRREAEILQLVLQGRLSREIAEALFVSESTVNWHVGNILKKTGVESRAKLIERYGAQESI